MPFQKGPHFRLPGQRLQPSKAACVRQVAAGARPIDGPRAQGISPVLLGRWQRPALEQAVPSSAERDEIKRRRTELKRVERERDRLKKSRDQHLLDAPAEAGWSTLKTELLPGGSLFASLEEARLEVAYYLGTYFNPDRRHSALGHHSPHQFERDLKTNLSSLTVCFFWTTPGGYRGSRFDVDCQGERG